MKQITKEIKRSNQNKEDHYYFLKQCISIAIKFYRLSIISR